MAAAVCASVRVWLVVQWKASPSGTGLLCQVIQGAAESACGPPTAHPWFPLTHHWSFNSAVCGQSASRGALPPVRCSPKATRKDARCADLRPGLCMSKCALLWICVGVCALSVECGRLPCSVDVTLCCFASDSKVLTCAAVWRMPKELEPGSHESPDDSSSTAHTLELLCHLDNTARGSMACVTWEPTGDGTKVISLADNHILLWDLQESSSQAVFGVPGREGTAEVHFGTVEPSPQLHSGGHGERHSRARVGHSEHEVFCIENAHGQLVRDLDVNPNKQYYLASCGDDCKVKFWDTRNATEPVKTLEEHSHWVWNVRYNHSHDQLVLTGSSDSRVILSNMVSISSEPLGHLVDDDDLSDQEERRPEEKSQEPPQDSVIATYEEHEDSVYAVDWSSADPWLFASLSYDGRLVINRVPRALKYHILL
ncbi:hypothetical protein MC885_006069 [Smutsia gigantea]|nr:hypothetical protein MC885_006069 [Smutsia gigantea]